MTFSFFKFPSRHHLYRGSPRLAGSGSTSVTDDDRIATAARTAPVSWAQRLGFLLDLVGAADRASSLQRDVRRRARDTALLLPGSPHAGRTPRDQRWRLRINAEVEVET